MDYYSACATHLAVSFREIPLAHGTGFFFLLEGRMYFVTALHTLTGRHWQTGQNLHQLAGRPDRITIAMWCVSRGESETHLYNAEFTMLLHEDDRPVWWEADGGRLPTDIAVFDLHRISSCEALFPKRDDYVQFKEIFSLENDFGTDFKVSFMEQKISIPYVNEKHGNYRTVVGQDLFIIGYPLNFSQPGKYPIWKRGSIATEPDDSYEGLPVFLIDAITREGLSGSPVVGEFVNPSFDNNGKGTLTKIGTDRAFAGIYTARIGARDDFSAQMGLVWNISAIIEIIEFNLKAN